MAETSAIQEVGVQKETIGVIGSGDFGRALGTRLVTAGYPVIFGSRDPVQRSSFLPTINPNLRGVPVTSIEECLSRASVVVLAIKTEHQRDLRAYDGLLEGKLVVDVSNPRHASHPPLSQAEVIQELLPNSKVVKAFSTLSAYSLEQQAISAGSRTAYVCGEDHEARRRIHTIAATMGLPVVDMGGLKNARALERSMQTVFPGWGWPLIVTGLWLVFWTVYSICRYYVLRESNPYTWERFPTNVLNKVASCMAMTLLALCYLPGCIVALLQLARGTKYRALPTWMDAWLKMRKQLGLYGLFFAALHTCMSICLLQPAYYSKWFLRSSVTIPGNSTQDVVVSLASRMTWMGETTVLLATLSTALYCIMGITSLPSVGQTLNWREWNVVQTYLGLLCLALACAHVTVKAAPDWVGYTFVDILQGLSFLSQVIPYTVLAIRLFLCIPCVNSKLWAIRSGHVNHLKGKAYMANISNGGPKAISNGISKHPMGNGYSKGYGCNGSLEGVHNEGFVDINMTEL